MSCLHERFILPQTKDGRSIRCTTPGSPPIVQPSRLCTGTEAPSSDAGGGRHGRTLDRRLGLPEGGEFQVGVDGRLSEI